MKKFPKVLHLTREYDRDTSYLLAHEGGPAGMTDQPDGTPVAVYQLVEVGALAVPHPTFQRKARQR